ncbi:FkbM family methyltransferase [Flagellimonas algicola]|uniref:FkbM family methyltransferase n=1 Tax=Flagellimonas algicola TaxID=2583815 RepID=UPI001EEEB967|nr:FkbM family methyltransferase [Allomuricauda algicola]
MISPLIPEGAKLHPSGTVTIKVSNIQFKLRTNQTSYITRQLFWKGPMAFEYTPIFKDLVKKVETFWDIGANIGYYSVLGCKANPDLRVRAFEPSDGAKTYLQSNVEHNQINSQVVVEPLALSNFKGEIEFHQIVNPKFPNIANLSGEHNIGTKKNLPSKKVRVKTLRMDDYASNIESIDLMKIDTEGAEVEILKGGLDTIKKYQPIIICETLFNKNEAEIEAVLGALGYEFFNHTQEGLQKVETLKRNEDNGVRDCFCVPPAKVSLIKEFLA